MTRAQFTAELNARITDPKNEQNSAALLREVFQLISANWANIEEDGAGGSDFDPENITTDLKFNDSGTSRKLWWRSFVSGNIQTENKVDFSASGLNFVSLFYNTVAYALEFTTALRSQSDSLILQVDNNLNGKTNRIALHDDYTLLTKKAIAGGYFTLDTDLDYVYRKWLDDALALKLNVSAYNNRYKGKYTTLVALQTAHPTASAGDYAQVDTGSGSPVVNYNWDTEEGWVLGSSGSSATDTDALPEGSVNLYFTDARAIAALASTLSSYALSSTVAAKADTTYVDTQDKKFKLDLEFQTGSIVSYVYFETTATLTLCRKESTISTIEYSTNSGGSYSSIAVGVVSLAIPATTHVIFRITYVTPSYTARGNVYLEGTY